MFSRSLSAFVFLCAATCGVVAKTGGFTFNRRVYLSLTFFDLDLPVPNTGLYRVQNAGSGFYMTDPSGDQCMYGYAKAW